MGREEFWGLTLAELFRELVIARQRRRDEFERDTRVGYQAVRIYCETLNKKRMPKFESFMPGSGPITSAPTPDDQRARFHALVAHVGSLGRLREVTQ